MDSGGLPICFDLSEGQRHDIVHAENLVEQLDEVNTALTMETNKRNENTYVLSKVPLAVLENAK